MNKLLGLLLLFPVVVFSSQSNTVISQKRLTQETFQQAFNRIKATIPQNKIQTFLVKETPLNKKVAIKDIDFSLAPTVITYEELIHMFQIVRDSRFLYAQDNPEFPRRISWLYPDDGCFSRAAVMGIKLESEHLNRPAKIFAFGELVIQTPYSSVGTVSWWYHVAAVVNYMGVHYVFDPALNSEAPMLVEDWYHAMGMEESEQGVVCNAYTYDPFDNCFKATSKSDIFAQTDQAEYLSWEWSRIESLGFDPVALLGEKPPWATIH